MTVDGLCFAARRAFCRHARESGHPSENIHTNWTPAWAGVTKWGANASRGFRAGLAAAACAFILVAASGARAATYELAVLQGLDKVTARISTIEAPVGDVVRFGTLEIIARVCDKRPPEETPESAAFLDIWEVRRGEPPAGVFRGWMFASSPALSALEHPVYDVWVLDCRNKASMPKAPLPR